MNRLDPAVVAQRLDRHAARLGPTATAFARRCYDHGIAGYRARLQQYGFTGRANVLDAGCGFGQWALALAELNERVVACDVSSQRVALAAELARDAGIDNVTFAEASLSALPYPDASFDGVFCYGVLPLTPWRDALAELARLVRPGGALYVNANGFGWYKNLWQTEPNRSAEYDPRLVAARALLNTRRYDLGEPAEPGSEIVIEPTALREALTAVGFGQIVVADEGCAGASDLEAARAASFFRGAYGGDLGVYEVIARRAP